MPSNTRTICSVGCECWCWHCRNSTTGSARNSLRNRSAYFRTDDSFQNRSRRRFRTRILRWKHTFVCFDFSSTFWRTWQRMRRMLPLFVDSNVTTQSESVARQTSNQWRSRLQTLQMSFFDSTHICQACFFDSAEEKPVSLQRTHCQSDAKMKHYSC